MFTSGGQTFACCHLGMPFGSLASVHAWHRIGSKLLRVAVCCIGVSVVAGCFLKALGRRLLMIALCHFVDDYFSADRKECIEVAKTCFARLVRACLGETAVAERKLESGNPLCVLGVSIELTRDGAVFWPSEDKTVKWRSRIRAALATDAMDAGDASKLAGQLQWASQAVFRRMGRALTRPIIEQSKGSSCRISKELRLALEWWDEVLGFRTTCSVSNNCVPYYHLAVYLRSQGSASMVERSRSAIAYVYRCSELTSASRRSVDEVRVQMLLCLLCGPCNVLCCKGMESSAIAMRQYQNLC